MTQSQSSRSGLEFELQRRLDDALNSMMALDHTAMRTYWQGATEGLASALGALQCTNAAHELAKALDRIKTHRNDLL